MKLIIQINRVVQRISNYLTFNKPKICIWFRKQILFVLVFIHNFTSEHANCKWAFTDQWLQERAYMDMMQHYKGH